MTEQTAIQVSNYDKIKALARNKATIERFAEMLGSKTDAMSYIASAMLAVANSDALMECTPSSIFNTVMRAAALRLSCDPSLRQAHIVPFYNKKKGRREAQFIPGYIGLNNLAQRTGKYRYLNAHELYEGQVLEVNQLTGEPQLHGRRMNDNIIGYYHYFELFTGFKHVLFMSVEELREHGRKYAPKNPMWETNFHDMAKKTVTRLHLLKDGVLDPFDRSIIAAASEDIEGDIAGDAIDATFTDQDDEQAEHLAVEKQAEKEAQPKRAEAEMMAELYGEPVPQPEPEQPTLAEAAQEEGGEIPAFQKSEKGEVYADMDIGQLSWHFNSLTKNKNRTDLQDQKLAYLKDLIKKKASQ
jgi:recombination protein RecT